jgi:hypothetical protein
MGVGHQLSRNQPVIANRPTGANGGTKLTAWARGTLNMLSALKRGL